MTNDKQILHEITKKIEGMNKLEAYEIIHKLETSLFYASSPIKYEDLKPVIDADIDPDHEIDSFQFSILPNGNFCEFLGCNNYLHIYKENKKMVPDWPLFTTYYFKSKYAPLELIKLTKKNVLANFEGKPEEDKILSFLRKNSVNKTDTISRRLLILDV
ncbi:hypothetical protein ABW636_03130 [Aquimarina sp. 2201CG1-2-11]|uniref:hypothetical protein n=1 Tax=Aquimarina discodermiae TaxID=3231043 RepID=UPI0034626762